MMRHLLASCFLTAVLPVASRADVPLVMTDFAPIQSLTAQVMGDLGQPATLLPAGADPHDFALRPSDAARLGAAELVIWAGPALTPWLAEPLATLAPAATQIILLDQPGWTRLPVRDIRAFALPQAADGHDDHGHDDHGHDDHGADAHDHDHDGFDPHAWLDPAVAQVWVQAIAAGLTAADPANGASYAANAAAAVARLAALDAALAADLQPLAGRAYVLPHDGYQYFEARYGLTAAGALSGSDARTPGPAQVAGLRDMMAAAEVVCVFSDAEIGDRWASLLTEDTAARMARIDGIGAGLSEGPDLYAALLQRLGAQFRSCLGGA